MGFNMKWLTPLAFVVLVKAASIERRLEPISDFINIPVLKAFLNQHGFITPTDDDLQDIAMSLGIKEVLNDTIIHDIVNRPTVMEFLGFEEVKIIVASVLGIKEKNLSPSFKDLLVSLINMSVDGEFYNNFKYLLPHEDSKKRRQSKVPSSGSDLRCGAFFYVDNTKVKEKHRAESHIVSPLTVQLSWIQKLVSKYGFTKPDYNEEFKDFGKSLGVNDPEVLMEVLDIYDNPVLFLYADPPSSIFFATNVVSGFGNVNSTKAKDFLLKLINTTFSWISPSDGQFTNPNPNQASILATGDDDHPECELDKLDEDIDIFKVVAFTLDSSPLAGFPV